MSRQHLVASICGLALVLASIPAMAGSLSGTITNTGGSGVSGMLVTAYKEDGKSMTSVGSAQTNSAGAYSIQNLTGDTYYLHARMAPGVTGNYGDRWYDAVAPSSNGYVVADADPITIASTDDLSGYDIQVEALGGIDGEIGAVGGGVLQSMVVRVEATNDFRVHHNDVTDGPCCVGNPHLGHFYMRGLPTDINGPTDYMGIVYDPQGVYETGVFGPWTVSNNSNNNVGRFDLSTYSADPYEPNDNHTAAGSDSITSLPFTSSDAFIGPRNGDVDWHCLTLQQDDRVLARARSEIVVNGTTREHPWTDPILSFWRGDRSARIAENDDENATTRGAFVDTGEIPADGRYCFAVSTYGDSDYDGDEHGSVGSYTLDVEMGNRRPTLDVSYLGTPVADLPTGIMVAEGETFVVDFTYGDPEADTVMVEVVVTDANGDVVAVGNVNVMNGMGTFEWMVSQTAAQDGPYTIRVIATDGEFFTEESVSVAVEGVNLPPTTPRLVSPFNMSTVMTQDPDLVVENSTDPDLDPLTYEYEVYYGPVDFSPDLSDSVVEDPSGTTALATSGLPENAEISWRARAWDGNAMAGYSAWTAPFTFTVDSVNDVPEVPTIVKPTDGEIVMTTTPAIGVSNVTDPEGEAVTFEIEIASDSGFGDLITTGSVPMEVNSDSTEWNVDSELEWGRSYWVRARSIDERLAMSDWSETVQFGTFQQFTPDVPGFGDPFQNQCNDAVLESADGLLVPNIMGDEVSYELQIFEFGVDPDSSEPIYEVVVEQEDGRETFIPLDPDVMTEDGHYTIRLRTTRGVRQSDWAVCDFWFNSEDRLPAPITFLTPQDGAVLPVGTKTVTVEIEKPQDPDDHPVDIALCWASNPDFAGCDADPANWERLEPQGQVTEYQMTSLLDGEERFVQACAIDYENRCGPTSSISFSVAGDGSSTGAEEGCGCASGRPGQAAPAALVLLGFVLMRLRRRR